MPLNDTPQFVMLRYIASWDSYTDSSWSIFRWIRFVSSTKGCLLYISWGEKMGMWNIPHVLSSYVPSKWLCRWLPNRLVLLCCFGIVLKISPQLCFLWHLWSLHMLSKERILSPQLLPTLTVLPPLGWKWMEHQWGNYMYYAVEAVSGGN